MLARQACLACRVDGMLQVEVAPLHSLADGWPLLLQCAGFALALFSRGAWGASSVLEDAQAMLQLFA